MQLKTTDLQNKRQINQERKKRQILNPQRHSVSFSNPDAIGNFLHVGPHVKNDLFYRHIP